MISKCGENKGGVYDVIPECQVLIFLMHPDVLCDLLSTEQAHANLEPICFVYVHLYICHPIAHR